MTQAYTHQIIICIEELDKDVTFHGSPSYQDEGYGPYEYWGEKGVHHDWQWICYEIEWDESAYTAEENAIIARYLEEASEKLIEKAQNERNDYQP